MKHLFLFSFLTFYWLLPAQYDNLNFERIGAKYGMTNGLITQIFEDGYGYLWFSTEEGVFRFDGYEMKAYRHDILDSTSLSHPGVNAIIEDKDYNIWAATTYGLNKLDRRTGTFNKILPFPDAGRKSKGTNNIREFYLDSKDNLWIACRRLVARYHIPTNQFHFLEQVDVPEAEHGVRCYYEDQNGTVWVGTSYGLLKINQGLTAYEFILPDKNSDSKFNEEIRYIHQSNDGLYWLATIGGLVKWDANTGEIDQEISPTHLQGNAINYLMSDSNDNIWIAIDNNGLGIINYSTEEFFHHTYQPNKTNSLNNNEVRCIYEDEFKNIWIGTGNGVCKVKMANTGFELLQNENGYDNISNHVVRVLKDSRGGIWSKTPEGVYFKKNKNAKGVKIEKLEKYKGQNIRCWFIEDYLGGIWVSLGSDGIFRKGVDDNEFQKLTFSEKVSENGINRMMFDKKDNEIVWIGSTLGLCKLNWVTKEEKWFEPLNDFPELASNRMAIFDQYGDNEIWMYYTYSNSIGKFDKKTERFELFIPPKEKNNVLEGAVRDIAISKDGNLWIATMYGLSNFNIQNKEFSIYGKREGLLEHELTTALIDENENIWVCGGRFFAQFDPQTKSFTNYPVANEVRHFHSKSRHLADDGSILFGSINGVYTFHPDKIKINADFPRIILTDFKVKNESYLLETPFEEAQNIILSHDENDITFNFSGIQHVNPENIIYKCKLIGFDEKWRELGSDHKMSYTNLKHGQYIFHVTASNGNGSWNPEGLAINLTITPAYWQTMWFKSLIILVFISIGYALFKNRQHQFALQRQKEMAEQSAEYKTRFLANVSHEIRTPMNAIIGLSKLALKTNLDKKQSKFIATILKSSQNLLAIINDLLDYSKLESGKFKFVKKEFSLVNLIEQVEDTFKYNCNEKNIDLIIENDPSLPEILIGDPTRLLQILTNLVGNAVKFTEEGRIWIKTKMNAIENDVVNIHFEIGDTGIGIPLDHINHIFESYEQVSNNEFAQGTGLGLSISKQLVQQQGGELNINSQVGTGTILWFSLEYRIFKGTLKKQPELTTQKVFNKLDILIVEDNQFNQLVTTEIIEYYINGSIIKIAENGKEALDILKKENFDIIIMDVKMPILNGYETTKILRASNNQTPILGVTANALESQINKCKEVGMNDVVTKPIDELVLIEKIGQLTQQPPRIDRKKLKKMLADDEKRVEKYLAIFEEQMPDKLSALIASIEKKQLEQASILAHDIKSQCRFLGLENIAELAFEIEEKTQNENNFDDAKVLVKNLNNQLQAVLKNGKRND